MALSTWSDPLIINQLNSGLKWPDLVISYAFPTSASEITTSSGEGTGFRPLNSTQQSAAELALLTWDDLIRQDFFKVTLGSNIEYGMSSTGVSYAHSYYPYAGSVWFNNSYSDLTNPVIGKNGFTTYVHETGHALGLKHMGDYNGVGNWTPSCYQDSTLYSVMSYFGPSERRGSGDVAWADWVGADRKLYAPQTPMMNDILAIQTMYGSESTRAEDTVYGFNSSVSGDLAAIYNFSQNKNPILCLYDSGGVDTLDLSGWSTSSTVSLVAGTFSDCNSMTSNISIARNVVIENAITGSGRDTLTGNAADNQLNAGAGNDQLTGAGGNDSLIGGSGTDTALYTQDFNQYRIGYANQTLTVTDLTASEGTDQLTQIETLQFNRESWTIEYQTGTNHLDTVSLTGRWADYQINTSGEQATLLDTGGSQKLKLFDSIERIQFTDATVALDIGIGQNAGEAYRLYQAAFDRTPDLGGLGYWIGQIDQGEDLLRIADGFMGTAEFKAMYGDNPSDQTFLSLLYEHVFDRAPDQAGYDYWQTQLNLGTYRSHVLMLFSESAENLENTTPLIINGVQYNSNYL